MPKFMNNRYYFSKLDLQIFSEDSGDDAGDDAGDGDDQDDDADDGSDEGGEEERKYTQADLDRAVARTIAKERKKAERAAKQKEKSGSSEKDEEENEDVKARKEAEGKASRLEVKVACFEAGVDKEAVDDVAALAHAYMETDEDLDLEEAIEKVVKKYPHFKKSVAESDEDAEKAEKKAWGERQRGSGKKLTGVEAAFLKKNPGLKY